MGRRGSVTQHSALSTQHWRSLAPSLLPIETMGRRLAALFTMALLLGLVLVLLWNVYVHHQSGADVEEPAMVALDARAA